MAKAKATGPRAELLQNLREKVTAIDEAVKNRMLRKKGLDVHAVKKLRKEVARIKTQLHQLTLSK